MPGQIERRGSPSAKPVSNSSRSAHRSSTCAAAASRPASRHDANIVPHDVEQPFAQLIEIAALAGEGMVRAPISDRNTASSGGRSAGLRAIQLAMMSPAIPPNTVELATPLPPSRLAPCTPPASSPATNRPRQFGGGVDLADHATHQVVRGRHDFDQPGRRDRSRNRAQRSTMPLNCLATLVGSEVAHLDVDAAVRRGAPGAHLRIDAARLRRRARGAFERVGRSRP